MTTRLYHGPSQEARPTATSKPEFDIRVLLARAGARIRSATRADCPRCPGRSRGTIAYTSEVFHCHRCNWSGNGVTLARELGLLTSDPAMRGRFRAETQRRARFEQVIRRFEAWREARIRLVSDRYLALSKAALRTASCLKSGKLRLEEEELAWQALRNFYDLEADLLAKFDFLTCAKASAWLESDATIGDLFALWRRHAA